MKGHVPTVELPGGTVQRRRKFDPKYATEIVQLAWLGYSDAKIAEALGIHRRTLHAWAKKHGFREAWDTAKQEADYRVVSALYQKAIGGDVRAMQVWLAARQPAVWRDKQDMKVEHSLAERVQTLLDGRQRAAERGKEE